jgi:hypothetical protein
MGRINPLTKKEKEKLNSINLEEKITLKDFLNICYNYDDKKGSYPESMYEGLALFSYMINEKFKNNIYEDQIKIYYYDGIKNVEENKK